MPFPIPLPSRAAAPALERRRRAPRPLGGDNGTIAVPSREAAFEGTGAPAHPGPLTPTDGALGAVMSGPRPVLDLVHRPNRLMQAEPIAYPSPQRLNAPERYIRRWHPMDWAVCKLALPRVATTSGTTNRADDPGMPVSPIPRSRRWVAQTFRFPFDQRVQADYLAKDDIQLTLGPRRFLNGSGAVMLAPYFPRLTVQPPTGSYGAQTTVLTPAAGGVSRFSV